MLADVKLSKLVSGQLMVKLYPRFSLRLRSLFFMIIINYLFLT